MPYKAVIFDRDGTLNATSKTEGGYVLNKTDMHLLPFVKESLIKLNGLGISRYVFTQQRCVGKGLVSERGLFELNAYLNDLLTPEGEIQAYYYCPHVAEAHCDCAKPSPKMILDILHDYSLQKEDVLVVGDSLRDYESAKSAGVDFAFVPNDLSKHTKDDYLKTGAPFFENLKDLVNFFFEK